MCNVVYVCMYGYVYRSVFCMYRHVEDSVQNTVYLYALWWCIEVSSCEYLTVHRDSL